MLSPDAGLYRCLLGAMDKELASLGMKEDTIFCAIGDHGEAFGEHGRLDTI